MGIKTRIISKHEVEDIRRVMEEEGLWRRDNRTEENGESSLQDCGTENVHDNTNRAKEKLYLTFPRG